MNLNKQILEAVHRGIKLALDDYQDIEPNSSISQTNDVINAEDIIKQKIDFYNVVVDLGLSSGTLWCKYNLGVDPNKLNKPENWYGDYYAWGETSPKKAYNWDTYEHGYGPYSLYKYVNNADNAADDNDNKTDGHTVLLPEDDAAYQNIKIHNFKFHIPTKKQLQELYEETDNEWVTSYQRVYGLNGYVFRKNNQELFLPAASYYDNSEIFLVGNEGYYWSSDLNTNYPSNACCLYLNDDEIRMSIDYRTLGFSIRPVINL